MYLNLAKVQLVNNTPSLFLRARTQEKKEKAEISQEVSFDLCTE